MEIDKDTYDKIMLAAVKATINENYDRAKYWLSQLPDDRLIYLQTICIKLADMIDTKFEIQRIKNPPKGT